MDLIGELDNILMEELFISYKILVNSNFCRKLSQLKTILSEYIPEIIRKNVFVGWISRKFSLGYKGITHF